MRYVFFIIALMILGRVAHAEGDDQYLRQDLVRMIARANSDYPDRRGEITEDDATHTVYHVSPPYDPFLTSYIEEQYITVDKASGHAFFSKVFRDKNAEEIIASITSFANPANVNIGKIAYIPKDYTVSPTMVRLPGGDFSDTLRCKGIAVAVLYANSEKSFAVLTIGVLHDADRAAAAVKLPAPHEKPWQVTNPTGHLSVSGTVITVKGWGADFDGTYDVAKIAKGDSCLSGDCSKGHGRKVLASISSAGQPRIRIMEGKFTHDIFFGDGIMLIDGEGPEVAGTYDISKEKVDFKWGEYQAKCVFHPKGSSVPEYGLFYADHPLNMYEHRPDYKHYVICTFKSNKQDDEPETAWERDVELPFHEYERDSFKISPGGRAEEAQRLSDRADNEAITQRTAGRCSCCGGRGTIVSKSFNHAMSSGVNYMRYQDGVCNCCHGTGRAADQTEYKAKKDGGARLDYRH